MRIRAPSFAWSRWKWTSFCVTAVKSFTGTFTSPNVSAPLQMALGISPSSPTLNHRSPGGLRQREPLPRGARGTHVSAEVRHAEEAGRERAGGDAADRSAAREG